MNTTKPKVRRVAWVVLGVVCIGMGLCAALAWENWFEVAYVPIGPLIQIGDQREVSFVPFTQLSRGGAKVSITGAVKARLLKAYPPLPVPPNAQSAQAYSLRFRWLPGPGSLCVFYDRSGAEVFRQQVRLPPLFRQPVAALPPL